MAKEITLKEATKEQLQAQLRKLEEPDWEPMTAAEHVQLSKLYKNYTAKRRGHTAVVPEIKVKFDLYGGIDDEVAYPEYGMEIEDPVDRALRKTTFWKNAVREMKAAYKEFEKETKRLAKKYDCDPDDIVCEWEDAGYH
jgi:hypothetical protein